MTAEEQIDGLMSEAKALDVAVRAAAARCGVTHGAMLMGAIVQYVDRSATECGVDLDKHPNGDPSIAGSTGVIGRLDRIETTLGDMSVAIEGMLAVAAATRAIDSEPTP